MKSIDRYLRKHRRRRKFVRCIRNHNPLRIVVGSGKIYDEGWCPSDIDTLNLLDRTDWEKAFKTIRIDAILAEHVWEHLTEDQGLVAARNCADYLRPGGYLRWAVPDAFHPSPEYQELCRPGGIGEGADDHKVFYNHQTATKLFNDVGLVVELKEHFDADGTFHQVEWDRADGTIHRSAKLDRRNSGGELRYTSLFLDAIKP